MRWSTFTVGNCGQWAVWAFVANCDTILKECDCYRFCICQYMFVIYNSQKILMPNWKLIRSIKARHMDPDRLHDVSEFEIRFFGKEPFKKLLQYKMHSLFRSLLDKNVPNFKNNQLSASRRLRIDLHCAWISSLESFIPTWCNGVKTLWTICQNE